MTTARTVETDVRNFLDYLLDSEVALYTNPVVNQRGRVSWRLGNQGAEFLPNRRLPAASDYRHWLEAGAYSAVLSDGALLQMTYEFEGHQLVAHRLAYVPCPFDVEPDLLASEPLVEVYDLHAEGHAHSVVLGTVVRFDFDRSSARRGHSASHLTINGPTCRIPCAAPVRVGQFSDFVFRHFYPSVAAAHPYLLSAAATWGERTVTDEESGRLHMSWRT